MDSARMNNACTATPEALIRQGVGETAV